MNFPQHCRNTVRATLNNLGPWCSAGEEGLLLDIQYTRIHIFSPLKVYLIHFSTHSCYSPSSLWYQRQFESPRVFNLLTFSIIEWHIHNNRLTKVFCSYRSLGI